MSRLDNLRKLKDELNITISGKVDFKNPCVFVANHSCLMDIFYLQIAINIPMIDLISPKLIYKNDLPRKKMVNDNLYCMPIEAHGGSTYSELCINSATQFLNVGISVGIFPEGVYLPGNNIYRGRTGASRILYRACRDKDISLVPVAIDVSGLENDLDFYSIDSRHIDIKILPAIDYKGFYSDFISSNDYDKRNKALHEPIDLAMESIAYSLGRKYIDDYVPLFERNGIMFSDGQIIPKENINDYNNILRYKNDLQERVKVLKREISSLK